MIGGIEGLYSEMSCEIERRNLVYHCVKAKLTKAPGGTFYGDIDLLLCSEC